MKQYGLIGYPLSHSFSKRYFAGKFEREKISDVHYDLYPIQEIGELIPLLGDNPGLCGLNVTIPHKIDVLNYLDWIEDNARAAGAVNCIRISKEAASLGKADTKTSGLRLEGFNTDIYGFEMSLTPLLKKQHNSALVLGDGGAARAVKCVLDNKRIAYKVVTRKPGRDSLLFAELKPHHISENKLIINTTPLGTSPNIEECPPIPYDAINGGHLLYDLIYNPEETLFLKKGRERGAVTKNGYEMLILQAERSWEIWNSKEKHP